MGSVAAVVTAAVPLVPAIAVAAGAGYVLGSAPIALIVGRRHGVDLRAVGDRNPGYWNAKEQLGRRAALPVLIGDAVKGLVAGIVGQSLVTGGRWWIGYLAVGAAMLGHAFPVFAGFKGGRSILTFVGGCLVLSPKAAAAAVLVTVVVSLATRTFAWGARAGVFGYPLLQAIFDPRTRVAATGCLMAIIGVRFMTAAVIERRRPENGSPLRRSGRATS